MVHRKAFNKSERVLPPLMYGYAMTAGVKSSTQDILKRFNKAFPQFYEQFVSSEIQLQNLKLAYRLYRSKRVVIDIRKEGSKSSLHFVSRNQSFLLSDIFGVLTAYGLTIHSLSLYGQISEPMLVFIKLTVSRGNQTLTKQTAQNVCRALREALAGRFEVEEMLAVEFNFDAGLEQVETEFYIDPVFHLPALLIEADNQPGLFYRVMYAIWQEDLLVVNANLLLWRGSTRLILYLLGPNGNLIPEYLGHKIAESVRQRLLGCRF
ncbi:MAG: hypothetical protein WA919_10795 [Coleofasciculaceae cyanobacterium]